MDSIYISPYITAYSEAGDDKPNDVTEADSVRSALYSLDEGVHTTPTQSTGTYVLSSRQCDGSGYVTDTDKMLQDMIEADTTGTASTSSPGSTIPSHRLSGSHSSISSIEDTFAGEQPSCGNEQDSSLKQHNEQLQEEKWTKPGGIPAKQIDSVFARDSAGLTSTVSSRWSRYTCRLASLQFWIFRLSKPQLCTSSRCPGRGYATRPPLH